MPNKLRFSNIHPAVTPSPLFENEFQVLSKSVKKNTAFAVNTFSLQKTIPCGEVNTLRVFMQARVPETLVAQGD